MYCIYFLYFAFSFVFLFLLGDCTVNLNDYIPLYIHCVLYTPCVGKKLVKMHGIYYLITFYGQSLQTNRTFKTVVHLKFVNMPSVFVGLNDFHETSNDIIETISARLIFLNIESYAVWHNHNQIQCKVKSIKTILIILATANPV